MNTQHHQPEPPGGDDAGEQLLEYETEAEPEPVEHAQPLEALRTEVVRPVVTVPTVPHHVTCSTAVVRSDVAGQNVVQLLPADQLRVRASIIVSDQPVVLAHSLQQAQDSRNTAAGTPFPNGAYVPASATASSPLVVTQTDPLWVAATSVTPARVTVIVERRSA